MRLSQRHLDQMIEHCRAALPDEACGLLAGHGSTVEEVLGAGNALHSPWAYELDEVGYRLLVQLEEGGRLLGSFHSHTQSDACPSASDRRQAYWPMPYVIVSLADREHPIVRAFRLAKPYGSRLASVVEEPVEVV